MFANSCKCAFLPASCVSPSRLVGMLLWTLWVFLRWRVCNATMAGSWLLKNNGRSYDPILCWCLDDSAKVQKRPLVSAYRSCACISGLLLRMSVCRCTKRRICGGRLSSLLLLKSRYSRSVRLMNSWLGMASMLLWLKFSTNMFLLFSRSLGISVSWL